MVDESSSPSTCWREVYEVMSVDDQHEESGEDEPARCPDCGLVVASDEEHHCPLVPADGDG